MPEPRNEGLRLGIDVSKIASYDGIGTFQRGLLAGFDELLRRDEDDTGNGDGNADDLTIRLYDPHGTFLPASSAASTTGDAAIRKELAPLLSEGELCRSFESRIGSAPTGDAIDVLLVVGWTIPPSWRGPTLYVVHDLTFLSHPELHTVDNRIHCLEGVLEALLAEARLVAVSTATADEIGHRLGVGEPRPRVIHPAPAAPFGPGDEATTERRLGERFGLAPGYVLAVGSLEPRKNLERLLQAHGRLPAEVRARHPLVVAGAGGWRNASLTDALDRAEARGDVHRLGRVSTDDLVTLYRGAALFAYPSLAEGFGLPVVEAMACDTPVLTSSRSSLPEAAGDAARLVDPEDDAAIEEALAELLGDDDRRAELAAAGRERVRELTWRRTAEELLELAESIR